MQITLNIKIRVKAMYYSHIRKKNIVGKKK